MSGKKKADFYSGTGRRKTAVARVWLYERRAAPVSGLIINGTPIDEYFLGKKAETKYMRPFQLTTTLGKFAASIKLAGGGKSAQLDAVAHGISRALEKFDAGLRPALKREGLLRRDSRETERKKYYLKKARKRPQYSKR